MKTHHPYPYVQSSVCGACERGDHAYCEAVTLPFCTCWRHRHTDCHETRTLEGV